ncbi:MAG TPA: YgcG family protein [Pseudolabrys sp.]|nr:YgcG family protein [Pseudolabrys sp.]
MSSSLGGRGTRPVVTIAALLCAIATGFALNLPALTGRVVDQANIIQPATRSAIEQKLADLEAKSGIQIAVATVTSLEGQDIEPYANELFRSWKLGEKTKNNGVLLLVAPNEHRVRIEVGYGLEGTLTDALSRVIIANAITPRFKAGDFSGGVSRGVDDIITVLTTDSSEWQQRPSLRLDNQQTTDPASWLLLFALIFLVAMLIVSRTFRWLFFNTLLNILVSSGGARGGGGFSSGGGFGGGGGFSGGGGSSGGGGASGSW